MNTAFWDAVWGGLACPTQLYAPTHAGNYKHVGRVDAAWKKVGGYIYESLDSMADNVDKRAPAKQPK